MPLSRQLLLLTGALSCIVAASGASGSGQNLGTSGSFHARRNANTDSQSSSISSNADDIQAKWLDATSPDLLGGAHKKPKPIEKAKKPVPQYVLDHAPLVHLSEDEIYWPSLLDEHLKHTSPYDDYLPVNRSEQHRTLDNLGDLNAHSGGEHVYLHSRDAVEDLPDWLTSESNTPIDPALPVAISEVDGNVSSTHYVAIGGSTGDKKNLPKDVNGEIIRRPSRSNAPAYLILVEHPENVVHAFWFFFYSFNLGNSVFGVGFGDHVGDWEHSVVRFRDGKPESMFVSEHAFGQSYHFSAMEKYVEQTLADDKASTSTTSKSGTTGFLDGHKDEKPEGKRPVIYSGRGTHAMYATPGIQAYILPFTILHDTTSRGPLWDPTLNLVSYHYTSPSVHNCTARNPWHPDCDDRKMTDIPTDPNNPTADPDSNFLFDSPDYDSINPTSPRDGFDGSPKLQEHTLTPTTANPDAATSWFYYNGRWGDKEYLSSDTRQYHAPIVGEKKFVDGPHGPRYKGLGRLDICPKDKCKLRSTRAPRLWVFNWLYNWAWLVGAWVLFTVLGITTILVVRHARRTHRGAWKLYVKYMERRKAHRTERVKLLADVERSPLLSEASEADAESVVSMEGGGINGRGATNADGGYGTIAESERPRLNQHQEGWNAAGSASSSPDAAGR